MALPQIDSLKTPDASLSRAASPRRGRLPLVNLPFVAVIVLLVGYGLLVCWSSIEGSNDTTYSFTRQLLFAAVGAVVMMLMWRVDYQRFANAVIPLFILNIALILSPHIPGIGTDAGMGAQSWLKLGIQVQPGEFAKITIILMDAALVARYGGRLDDLREYLKVVFFILVPFLAIMTQPDLGTGLVYLAIGAMALVAGGARSKYLLITLALGIAAIAAVFAIDQLIYNSTGEYKLLKQYQRNRLLVFLDQDGSNTSSSGYNLQQAKIAIGSGGLFGKGTGDDVFLKNIGAANTDLVFGVISEQFGLILALCAALLSTIMGTAAAVGMNKLRSKYMKAAMNTVTNLPMVNPEIITGISLMLMFVFFGRLIGMRTSLNFGTMLIAHVTFCLPYVILQVLPKLRQMDPALPEAAMDLGCTPLRAFAKVELPEIFPGILTGLIMSFTLSLDDFVISYFTSGNGFETLPIRIYNMTKKTVTPKMYALATLIFFVILALLLVTNLSDRSGEDVEATPRKKRRQKKHSPS